MLQRPAAVALLLWAFAALTATVSSFVVVGSTSARAVWRHRNACTSSRAIGSSSGAGALRMGAVREITGAEFEVELADTSSPILLDIFAVWCGPCVMLAPELEKAAEELGGQVRVLKIDSDKEDAITSALRVYGLPTLLYIKDGQIVYRTEGAMPAEAIVEVASVKLLGAPEPDDPSDGLFIETN
ncbi:thioredoxin-related protein [Tribonema minus]|uniref:Thioredoxin-related protein n=1 Tax=Tribonema minus TaxID=303371 RepID=A0A835Z7J6_9STRA|nr:thioredoxin-related protein [Tribonema minus]